MTGRLSEEAVVQSLDTGLQSLVWKSPFSIKSVALAPKVDFKAIQDAKDPEASAQAVPRRDMYLALVTEGPEDALDILPLLSAEQFVSVMDNESWHDGQLVIHQAIRWLDLYKNLGEDQLYKRFRQLDEEYQVALLNPYMEMVDEETFEKLSHDEQDKFTAMPCNTLWWRVKNADEKIQEFVSSLVQNSIGEDAAYIYSLLGMASMLPPNEQEALIKQFRDARQEEDGFVSIEESLELFAPFDGEKLYSQWKSAVGREGVTDLVHEADSKQLFLDTVLRAVSTSGQADPVAVENVQRSFAYLANAISSACRVAPDDVHGLTSLLQQVHLTVNFGLEVLSGGDISKAVDILFTEYPKTIFRFAISAVDSIRVEALSGLRSINAEAAGKLELLWRSGKFGAALWQIDRSFLDALGFDGAELLKGLFNRFAMLKDEVIDAGSTKRARFRPLATVSDYSQLLTEVRNLFPKQSGGSLV